MAIDLNAVHRLQRLRGGLPVGEQHPGGRQASRSSRVARCTGSASTATSPGDGSTNPRSRPAGRLPALRERAVRAGVPGGGHGTRRRGPQRHGLQPLHRHPLLRQQLPVQGAALQLLQLPQGPRGRAEQGAQAAFNPEVTVRVPRRDGEVHVLRAAHPERQDRGQEREGATLADGEIVTACQDGVPDRGDRVRRSGRQEQPRVKLRADGRSYEHARGAQHKPRTSTSRVKQPEPGAQASPWRPRRHEPAAPGHDEALTRGRPG
jgi:hypothetical protein